MAKKAKKADGVFHNPTPKKRGPRSQALPGLEQVRDVKLDNLCEGIGEQREVMNAASVEEKGMIKAALQRMTEKGTSIYKHNRIELARVPGADRLRVRVVKDQGDAEVEAADFD